MKTWNLNIEMDDDTDEEELLYMYGSVCIGVVGDDNDFLDFGVQAGRGPGRDRVGREALHHQGRSSDLDVQGRG